MFLTGFDATTLNTLRVDKNLKMHGLIQAFSRTNRILNSVKSYGNIVCFRDLSDETDEAIALFGDRENILDDVVFEMELVKQVEVNIDYILDLVAKYHQSHCKNKEILGAIDKAVGASPELRSKKELINGFISTINADSNVLSDWNEYVKRQKEKDVSELIETERLKPEETRKFLKNAFADGALKTTGTAIDEILPPMSLFNPATAEKKANIIEKLKVFFNDAVRTGIRMC